MKRRDLFGRLVAVAAAVTLAPAAKAAAAPSEDEQIRALVDDALANPDKHPDLWARARELTGEAAPDPRAEYEMVATVITTPDIGVPVDAALYVRGTTVLEGDLIVNGKSITELLSDARAEGYTHVVALAEEGESDAQA